ncbi:MAG: LuxR C-terminal-related transcriptional regulator [Mycetocola sp.]
MLSSTSARLLLDEVKSEPRSRLLVGVSGVGGAGKSTLLDQLEGHYRAAGVDVMRGPSGAHPRALNGRGTVLVDDAHKLNDSALTELHSVVEQRDLNLIVAYRSWPQPPGLLRLARTLERYHPSVVLGPLDREAVTMELAAALGTPPQPALVTQVVQLTAGMPWLVDRIAGTLTDSVSSLDLCPVMDRLGYDLDRINPEVRELLLALSVGFDLSGEIPETLGQRGEGVDALIAEARAAGLILPDGRQIPLIEKTVIHATPLYRVRNLQRSLVTSYPVDRGVFTETARALARSGLKDDRVAKSLSRAGDAVLTTQPSLASALYGEALDAGADELAIAARRAQAAAATGDLEVATGLLDKLFAHENPPDLTRASDVASAVWAQRGMLVRSAEVYRWLGTERAGCSAALAGVAMIGVGDTDGAEGMFSVGDCDGSRSLSTVAVQLIGQGIRDSITPAADDALPSLIRASDVMSASGAVIPLPDYPAALAALVALHSGELSIADSILDAALERGQCGSVARPRLLLLRAWTAMQADRPERARAAIADATQAGGGLVQRDELLLRAIEVGLARRADDVPALVLAWQRARENILHAGVDLYSLLPFEELVVAAARLRESGRLQSHLAQAWDLLTRLGEPPLWSVGLHWSAVQAAILTERPSDLAPHAAALVRAAQHSHLAFVLAAAGRAWMSVLAQSFEVMTVETAARGLASVGMTWDGSRLAGHAAARTEERKDMARLLACARDLHPGRAAAATSAPAEVKPAPRAPVGGIRDDTGLSAREREIARLVLEGKTYREIGEAVFISPRTAEHHIARIRSRLGASNRSELLTLLRVALEGPDAHGE